LRIKILDERAPHPGPLPIGSADSADAEREKRSPLLGKTSADFCSLAFAISPGGHWLNGNSF
jgi:hypothetical protein